MKVFKPDSIEHYNKFVVMIWQDGRHTLATGPVTSRHKDIASEYYHHYACDEQGYWDNETEMWVAGGGTMKVDQETKAISFYEESRDFGPFDHVIVAELARKAMREEGYSEWKLEVTPSLPTLPYFK